MSTATVETLTAEVRVLMVGNRQVTLSVYRQLDKFTTSRPLSEFAPFGRVSSGTKYAGEDPWGRTYKATPRFEFVGRDNPTGALMRMIVMQWECDPDYIGRDAIDQLQQWESSLPLIVLAGLR